MKKQLLLFVLTFLPLMANADDGGTCGENLTWAYVESTKTLTLFTCMPVWLSIIVRLM